MAKLLLTYKDALSILLSKVSHLLLDKDKALTIILFKRGKTGRCLATIFLAGLIIMLTGCSSSDSAFDYSLTKTEGRKAVQEQMNKTGASSLSLALVDGDTVVWLETFGYADKESLTAPGTDTMYCIGSTSKMLAAIAVMKLVELDFVAIDTPLVNYIPSFSMLSPEYNQITVRMLINHAAGFPGTDERNAETTSPLSFSFSAQIRNTLKTKRLKHMPGYLNVYCNDGFTMVEELVLAVTGKSYAQFVQDEVFTPLGMSHSHYPLDYFPADSFVKRYDSEGNLRPQLFLNTFGSGGLYSTPADMAKVAMMLIGGGALGNVRILRPASVAAMGVDQTTGKFNPVKSYSSSFGLGWDTVLQPGLRAVDVTGWQKGGDVPLFGSVMTVAPDEGLAVIVMGASGGFASANAIVIAERILLMALFEKGRIAAMPEPLIILTRPEKMPAEGYLDSVCGYYTSNSSLMEVRKASANSLSIYKYETGSSWQSWFADLKMRDNDRFSNDANPGTEISFVTADGRQYLITRYVTGYGHYQDSLVYAQKVYAAGLLPEVWTARLGKKWLLTNEHPDFLDKWSSPAIVLHAVDNMLVVQQDGFQVVNPLFGDFRAAMTLLIPQINGRDIDDVFVEMRSGEEWLHHRGSYLYRPGDTVAALADGINIVPIGGEGLSEWRQLNAVGATKTVVIAPVDADGRWKIYDSSFRQIDMGAGARSLSLSDGIYYLLLHNTASVNIL